MDPSKIICNRRMHSYRHLFVKMKAIENNKISRILSPEPYVYARKKSFEMPTVNQISANVAQFYITEKEKNNNVRFSFGTTLQPKSLKITEFLAESPPNCEQYEKYLLNIYQIPSLFTALPDMFKIAEQLQEVTNNECVFRANIPTRQEIEFLSEWLERKLLGCESSKQYVLMYSIAIIEIAREVSH